MSKKEKFSAPIECPKCGNKGSAEWEENEDPVHGRGFDAKLISVTGAFETTGRESVRCSICGAKVR